MWSHEGQNLQRRMAESAYSHYRLRTINRQMLSSTFLDEHGMPTFQALQHRSMYPKHTVVFDAFDLLHLNGEDPVRQTLEERTSKLPALLKGSGVLLSSELSGSAAKVIGAVRRLGLEGVIAKRRSSRYEPSTRSHT
jgi:bifunctional non-homologous end joining protein LigD